MIYRNNIKVNTTEMTAKLWVLLWAREVDLHLKVLAVYTGDKGLNPNTHVQVAYDQLSIQPQGIWPLLTSVHTHIHVADTHIGTHFLSLYGAQIPQLLKKKTLDY